MWFDHFDEGDIGRRKEERGNGVDMRFALRTAKYAVRDTPIL